MPQTTLKTGTLPVKGYRECRILERLNRFVVLVRLDGLEAKAHINKADQQRNKWTYALYGVDWEDPSLYDMVFNLGRLLNVEEAATISAARVREHSCFDFTPEHQATMKDFALASDVRATLAMEIPAAKVKEIKAEGDVVSVWMTSDDLEHVDDVRQVARTVPGVARIDVKY